MPIGTVTFFRPEKGWGAISSAELPDGYDAWVHCSVIEGVGYRELVAGEIVDFDVERADQDSFRYRATRVRRQPGRPCRHDNARVIR